MSESSDRERDWMIEGTAHISGLEGLPSRILDMNEAERYAVFSDGETLLLVPDSEVNP